MYCVTMSVIALPSMNLPRTIVLAQLSQGAVGLSLTSEVIAVLT